MLGHRGQILKMHGGWSKSHAGGIRFKSVPCDSVHTGANARKTSLLTPCGVGGSFGRSRGLTLLKGSYRVTPDLFSAEQQQTEQRHTYTELYRHRCEVRWLMAERTQRGKDGKRWLRDYLDHPSVKGRRDKLMKDIRSQWELGNRGEYERWDLS